MKPLFLGIQCSVLVGVLIFSYYLGRPVYWEIVAKVTDSPVDSPSVLDLQQKDVVVEPSLEEKQDITNQEEHLHIKNDKSMNMNEGIGPPVIPEKRKDTDVEKEGKRTSSKKGFLKYKILRNKIWDPPPPGSKMPPLDAFILTDEMAQFRAANNVIVVTFANNAFLDFVLNWARHLTELKVFNILVGAMDREILEALFWRGVPVFDMGSNMKTIDVGWGTPTFHKMGREKVILVNKFLSMGYELVMCDTDMVWLKNPLPYFARFPTADVLVSSDEVVNSVDDDRLEVWERAQGAYNIGIFLWRPSKAAKKFALEWREQLLADDKIWDQNGFNDLMRRTLGPSVDEKSGLFYAYDGKLKLGVLPVSIFCSGHTYFVQALYEQLELEPYAVHTTYQFAGTEGKRHRLREAKVFYDKPEYYDAPGGFVSFQPLVPGDLLTNGEHSVETHFKLMNYQIRQIRDALAIASILNRILVMPPLWCRLDRMWYGHPGKLPGTKTRQPFLCPLDHVFEVNRMLENLDEAEFGKMIDLREYSFLENPRLPNQVKDSKLKVKLCNRGLKGCSLEAKELIPKKLKLPRNSTEDEIREAFSKFIDIKIIEFSSLAHAFGGFTNKGREDKFRRRVKRYTGIWCCVEHVQRGHIYYDIYWDEKPKWKPLPPLKDEDDHPPL